MASLWADQRRKPIGCLMRLVLVETMPLMLTGIVAVKSRQERITLAHYEQMAGYIPGPI